MRTLFFRVLTAVAFVPAGMAMADEAGEPIDGQREYAEHCAVCHGERGEGDGPLSETLGITSTDLTGLTASNGGYFPVDRVRSIIDGRAEIAQHGPRVMPVWGWEYRLEFEDNDHRDASEFEAEMEIGRRIDALVDYLHSIQRVTADEKTRG